MKKKPLVHPGSFLKDSSKEFVSEFLLLFASSFGVFLEYILAKCGTSTHALVTDACCCQGQ